MDSGNNLQQLCKSLKELEETATRLKADCQKDLKLNLQVHRSDTDIKKRQERHQLDQYIFSQRKLLDAGANAEQIDISMAMKASLREVLTKALHDQRAAFAEKMKHERAILNQAVSKFIQENEENMKMERAKVDKMIKQAWEQMDEGLEMERTILKCLIQSFIQKEQVRGTIEKVEDKICIQQGNLFVLMDNECDLDVVMRFKVHIVNELYPDLKKYYDSRENSIGQFTIVKPHTTVQFVVMLETLRDFGYRGAAELYYLDPIPGSTPSTGLKKIDGQEEVNELVLAHAAQRTKICHLYLVGPEDDMADIECYDDGEEQGDMSP